MSFWGVEVLPKKTVPFVPPPELSTLHLSQATLGQTAKAGTKVSVKCKVQDGPHLRICNLKEGGMESCNLDLVFNEYTEFEVEGDASVHLTGYYMPVHDHDHCEDDEDEDDEADMEGEGLTKGDLKAMLLQGGQQRALAEAYMEQFGVPSDDDYEDEIGSEEEDDSSGSEMDYDDESNDSEAELDDVQRLPSNVVIEEIKEETEVVATEQGASARVARQVTVTHPDTGVKELLEGAAADVTAEDKQAANGTMNSVKVAAINTPAPKPSATPAAATKAAAKGNKRKASEAPASDAPPSKRAASPSSKAADAGSDKAPAEADAQVQQQGKKLGKAEKKKLKKQQQEQQPEAKGDASVATPLSSKKSNIKTWENGFSIEELAMGEPDGKLAKPGKKVVVKYRGSLASNGKVFDETKGNKTFTFRLGVGEVIKGWDRGVQGMRTGDKRRLTVPPQMAYGSSGIKGTIPSNATLKFDVQLVDVKN